MIEILIRHILKESVTAACVEQSCKFKVALSYLKFSKMTKKIRMHLFH